MMDFRKYIKEKILKPSDRILEFGPLTRPTTTKETHPNIYFADVRSTEEIKKLYSDNEYLKATGLSVDIGAIVDIDFVIKTSYKETFKNVEKFDVVILSHVVEHMPDIIDFFQDIQNTLKKNSKLIIVYPDAKFCFDHFRNGTSFVDAYDAHRDKNNLAKRVFDFVYNVVPENNPAFFWSGTKQDAILPKNSFKKSQASYDDALSGVLPDDVHFWPFSNYQLVKFLYDMDRAGMLGFNIDKFYPTPELGQECMVILSLKRSSEIKFAKYKKILEDIRIGERQKITSDNILLLEKEAASLRTECAHLKGELESIYGSRRWRYVSKLVNIKKRLFG